MHHIGNCNPAHASAMRFGARRPMPAEGQGHQSSSITSLKLKFNITLNLIFVVTCDWTTTKSIEFNQGSLKNSPFETGDLSKYFPPHFSPCYK
jgi:hypothetical protein